MTKIGSFITRNAFDVFYLCILRCSQLLCKIVMPLLCKILIDMKYTKYPNQYLYEMKTEMNYNKNMDFRYLLKPLN